MSAEARAFVNTLPLSDPLSVLVLRTIAENTRPDAPRQCTLAGRLLAAECKTTLRKLSACLRKLADAGVIAVGDPPCITLLGFEAFHASLSGRASAARTDRADPVQPSPDVARPKPPSSPSPPAGSKHDPLLDDLKASGLAANVIETYLRPVARLLIIGHPNPQALFTEATTELMDYPPHVLEALYRHTRKTRTKIVSLKNIADDLKAVLPTVRRFRILPAMKAQWTAWKSYYRAKPRGDSLVRYHEGQGYFSEISEWPPGHWQNLPDTDEAETNERAA